MGTVEENEAGNKLTMNLHTAVVRTYIIIYIYIRHNICIVYNLKSYRITYGIILIFAMSYYTMY